MERCVTFASDRSTDQSALSFQVGFAHGGPQTTTAERRASHRSPACLASEAVLLGHLIFIRG